MQYSQYFIFFVTYKWVQKARVFVRGMPFQPSVMWHSSLLGSFLSYKENEVFWILCLVQYSWYFIFFLACKWVQKSRVFVRGMPFQASVIQHSRLWGSFLSYKENEVVWKSCLVQYSWYFIFFLAYKWVQKARVFVRGMPFQPSVMWQSSLLGSFLSYEENEVWWIGPLPSGCSKWVLVGLMVKNKTLL